MKKALGVPPLRVGGPPSGLGCSPRCLLPRGRSAPRSGGNSL